jgi:YgiT-type zinc finger domain-containing protein
MTEVEPTICPLCDSTLRSELVDKTYEVAGRTRRVRGVRILVCTACGERFATADGAATVDKALGIGTKKKRPAA